MWLDQTEVVTILNTARPDKSLEREQSRGRSVRTEERLGGWRAGRNVPPVPGDGECFVRYCEQGLGSRAGQIAEISNIHRQSGAV
jgi:hypothetical protein